jgi:type IX secretion system PorP/SprF family membrane protein
MMYKIRFIVICIPLILCSFSGFAQQQPLYSQYTLSKYLYNPAIAGADGYTTIHLLASQQLVGFENPPSTFVLSGQTRILEDSYILRKLSVRKNENKKSRSGRVGVGGTLFSDKNGIIRRTGLQLTYAYHLNLNNKMQLSFGLSASAWQFHLDDAGAVVTSDSDPLLTSTKKSFFVPDANAGTYLLMDNFYAGVSMSNLFGSYLKLGADELKNYRTPRYYYFLAGYKIYPTEKLKIEPSFIVQSRRTNFELDINTTVTYDNLCWAGLSWRTNNTLVAMMGVNVKDFYFGYSYDADFATVRNYTSGSHEIVAGIRLGDNNARRARWLHKDMRNFGN